MSLESILVRSLVLSMAKTGVKLDLSIPDSKKAKTRVKLELSIPDSQKFIAQHGKDRSQARSLRLR